MSSTKNRKEQYLVNIEDYKVIRCIKRGGFGIINLIRNKSNGKEYASKTNLTQTGTQNKLLVSREVRILIEIQHDTIIQFRGFSYSDFDGKKNVTILMDYMKNGSLSDLIDQEMKSLCPPDYDNTKRQILLVGIARGMMILHQHHIIHRDLKPENILLDDDFRPRITDFGLSKFFDPHHSMNQSKINTGTASYMAPEVINSDNYNSKADVYAFGIIMYEIIAGNRAYNEYFKGKNKINEFQLKLKVTQGLRPNLEEGIKNKNLRKLISKCLSENPKERPTFSELFIKLSLTRDEFFLEFEGNDTELTLTDDDEGEEEDVYGEIIDKKYSLDGVNFEELLDYVEEIKSESKPFKGDVNAKVNNEEIDKLKSEINELKKITKNQFDALKEQVRQMTEMMNQQNNLILQLKEQINVLRRPQISCNFKGEYDPKGIVDFLSQSLQLSAGGSHNSNRSLTNIMSNNDNYFENYLCGEYKTNKKDDSWIEFDFGSSTKVDLHSYFIRSNGSSESYWYHPKSWRIEGSNNKNDWILLDKRENEGVLNGPNKQSKFQCNQNKFGKENHRFRYIRYFQDDCWHTKMAKMFQNPYNISIQYIELYGDIYQSE